MRSIVFLALALCGCATQAEPPPVVTAPVEHRMTGSKYNEAVNADVSCLSAEQQAAYAERQKEMLKKATESLASTMIAARVSGGRVVSADTSAARDTLKQCESNLPADADKSRSCVAERNAAVPPAVAAIRQAMMANAATRMKEAAALRAEFPPCPVKTPSEEKSAR